MIRSRVRRIISQVPLPVSRNMAPLARVLPEPLNTSCGAFLLVSSHLEELVGLPLFFQRILTAQCDLLLILFLQSVDFASP
jgi:hypothetical protein